MGKQLLFDVLDHKDAERVPWVPFSGVHAGLLKGYSARTVLTDKDKLVEAVLEVNKLYRPDGVPVSFDLQLEAEVLDCELLWAEDAPPSVASHPLAETDEIPTKIPTIDDGRIGLMIEATRELKAKIGDETAIYAVICGPFTLAAHLRGNVIFRNMIKNTDYVKALLAYTTAVAKAMSDLYIEAGADVIAVTDPLVSQVSPKHFRNLLAEGFIETFKNIRAKGARSAFFVCGDATRQIEEMCLTEPDALSVDENVDIVAAKQITDRYNLTIGGNIPLTTVMLYGNQQDNIKCALDTLDSLDNTKNFVLSPGCDMPYATPIENTVGVAEAVLNTDQARVMVENYEASDLMDEDVDLPDYANVSKPLIEAFTLDSATCAACTYMWGAAEVAKEKYGDAIDIVEYKYTRREDIPRIKKMQVAQLPSLYINGELKWSSLIPSEDEFYAEIDKALGK
ncbi:MAG: uroporphyrinogen decarboxylase family protein [Brooklawnia sp.]|jgi:uroporphyrinogen decarboxylase